MQQELVLSWESLEEMPRIAQKLMQEHADIPVWCLHGEMGVGKTALTKALCHHLGVADVVQSPTFSIVNEYATAQGKKVYHFDFYRIADTEEAAETGCEDYFFSGNLCLIEWPAIVIPLLPDKFVEITITLTETHSRNLKTRVNGQ